MTAAKRHGPAAPESTRPLTAVLWLALAVIFCLHVLSRLVQQSMLLDGTIYASIARNFAMGEGQWWRLHFSNTLFAFFAEHPPLLMWIESVGFSLFGDTLAVEKGFSLLTAPINAVILLAIWRQLNPAGSLYRPLGAFALILCLVSGKIGAALANGLIENVLMIFTSLAGLLIIVAYGSASRAGALRSASLIIGAGVAIILALLTKGPVGLFPLAVPLIHAAVFRAPSLRRAVFDTAILAALVLCFILALWLIDAPHRFLVRYAVDQLFSSLSGARGYDGGGWKAVVSLVSMMIYPLCFAGALGLTSWMLGAENPAAGDPPPSRLRNGIFLSVVGLSASLPILISPRIATFYYNPSLEYFALALACCSAPAALNVCRRLGERSLRRLQMLLIAGLAASLAVVATNVGKPGRDRDIIVDADKIAAYLCPSAASCKTEIAACDSVWEEWELHAYLQRNHRFDLAKPSGTGAALLLVNQDCAPPAGRAVVFAIDLGLANHRLLKIEASE